MDNLLRQVDPIKTQGAFFLPISGDLKQPSVCTRDIAATAARLLLDRSWNGVGSVPVLGPEDLSYNDMARIMSEVLDKPVHFQCIAGDAFKARLLEAGMSDAMDPSRTRYVERIRSGPGYVRTSNATLRDANELQTVV